MTILPIHAGRQFRRLAKKAGGWNMSDPESVPRQKSQATPLQLLIDRISNGEQEALADLLEQTRPLVSSIAQGVVSNPESAEEITMDVFLQIWRSAGSYDPHRGSARAWICTIARSRALDHRRSLARDPQKQELESQELAQTLYHNPETASLLSETQTRIRSALSHLNHDQRLVIENAYFSGLSQSEMAEKLGVPLGTVKTRVRLAQKKLRHRLAPLQATLCP